MNNIEKYLIKCISQSNIPQLQQIIFRINPSKYNINSKCINGYTPFMHSIIHNNKYIADILLHHGANPNILTNTGYSVYDVALKFSPNMVHYLLSRHIHITNKSKTVKVAIKTGCFSILYHLISSGNISPNIRVYYIKNKQKMIPLLYYAINKNLINLVSLLINMSVNLSFSSYKGYTPLEYSISKNKKEISLILFRNGARFRNNIISNIVQNNPVCHSMIPFVDSITE